MAAFDVLLDDFHLHVFGSHLCRADGNAASAHDHDVADVLVVVFSGYLTDVGDVLLHGHEVHEVQLLQGVVTTGDDGVHAPLDGNDEEGGGPGVQLMERNVEYVCRAAQLDGDEHQFATVDLPPLADPAHLDGVHDFAGGKHFRVDE